MKLNKVIFPSIALATVLAGCDDQLMEWQESDPTVKPSEIPLQLAEQIALYKPIKEYVAEYRPGLNLSLGMGADMYLDDPAYKAVVDENFTGVTLGNAMKMGVLMKANGSVDFTTVDRILAALPAGMKLYGHNMLWHTQQQQTYLKSLIAPKLVQEQTGGADGIANILVGDDSDFEGGTKGKWGSWGNSSTSEVVAGAGVDGSYGLVLTNPTDGSDYYVAQLAYDTPLQAGKEYKIRFSAKSDSPAGSLQIAYQNSTDYSGGGYISVEVGTDWTICEASFTIPEDKTEMNRVLINFGKVGTKFYLDNIRFGEYTEPAPDPMENILVGDDSDFEGGTKGKWGSWGNSSTSEVVAGKGVDGSYGLVLTNPTDGSDYYVAQLAYDTPLLAGKEYMIQFSAKSDSPAGSLQIAYQNSSDYSGGGYISVDVGTDWVTCEASFTIPEDKTEMNRVLINFGKVGTVFYLDNIKFGVKNQEEAKAPRRAASYHYELKTPEEKRAILTDAMEQWIKSVAEHVGNRVDAWDVINEPITDGVPRWRGIDGAFGSNASDGTPDAEPVEDEQTGLTLNWASEAGNQHWYWGYYLGKDYAVKAFEFARRYAPEAKLFVNDYNLETNPSKLAELINFVNYIDQNGAKVDGIGTQMHVNVNISKEQVDAMFKTIAATGKLVRITELDVAFGVEEGKTVTPSAEQLVKQSETYRMILSSYFENVPEAQQSAITIWTLSDNKKEHEYWLKGDAPNIFDSNYQRKVAYKGVCDAIAGTDIADSFSGENWKDLHSSESSGDEESEVME